MTLASDSAITIARIRPSKVARCANEVRHFLHSFPWCSTSSTHFHGVALPPLISMVRHFLHSFPWCNPPLVQSCWASWRIVAELLFQICCRNWSWSGGYDSCLVFSCPLSLQPMCVQGTRSCRYDWHMTTKVHPLSVSRTPLPWNYSWILVFGLRSGFFGGFCWAIFLWKTKKEKTTKNPPKKPRFARELWTKIHSRKFLPWICLLPCQQSGRFLRCTHKCSWKCSELSWWFCGAS